MIYIKILKTNKNLKILRTVCQDISLPVSKEDEELALKMLDYIKKSQDDEIAQKEDVRPGVGLAAPQVGVLKRIIVVHIPIEDEVYSYALANPKIIAHSVKKSFLQNGEGCLSVDEEHEGYVHRFSKITLNAYDIIKKKEVKIIARGYLSIVLQHEIDHLNGILFYDHINKEDPFKIEPNATPI